jgi:hypothetical protein
VRRAPVLVALAAVAVLVGVIDHAASAPASPSAPAPAASLAAAAAAESSHWYCAGGTGSPTGPATERLYLANRTGHVVQGLVTVLNDAGGVGRLGVSVPPHGQTVVSPATVQAGSWLADSLRFDGGGVTVTEAVSSPYGWAVSPCSSTTSGSWYFASGTTSGSNVQFVSLFNPTADPAVVDLTVVTAHGPLQPAPFQGLVVLPNSLQVLPIARWVQDEPTVATEVLARSGRVVAAQLQVLPGQPGGLVLLGGAVAPATGWTVARSVDVPGGHTTFHILNPGSVPERVTVSVRLGSGRAAPLVATVDGQSTWNLDGNSTSRIPLRDDYTLDVSASGGPGVVVTRTVAAPPGPVEPQYGGSGAVVTAPNATSGSREWLLAGLADSAGPATRGAAPEALGLANPTAAPVRVTVSVLAASGPQALAGVAPILLGPGQFSVLGLSTLAASDGRPLLVAASGPVVVSEDLLPSGAAGVVSQTGIPLSG